MQLAENDFCRLHGPKVEQFQPKAHAYPLLWIHHIDR